MASVHRLATITRPPLSLGPYDMPDASLVVPRGTPCRWPLDRHLTGTDVGLVIEILEPDPDVDLGPVTAAYAAGGVPALWIVDLRGGTIDAHAEPVVGAAPAYREVRRYGPGERIPLVLDGRQVAELDVAELLPERPSS